MAVAAKYRVQRDFKWMGVPYARGDSISRDTILSDVQVGKSKLGTLQRTGYIGLDLVGRPLSDLTKTELVDYGREVGADVDQNMVKKDLISAIEGVL